MVYRKNAWPILERWSYSLHDPRAISAKCDKYANFLSQPAMNPWCERNIRPNLGLSNLWHAVILNLPFFNDISLISFQHRRSFRLRTSTFFEDLGESWGKLWAKMLWCHLKKSVEEKWMVRKKASNPSIPAISDHLMPTKNLSTSRC